MTQLHVHGHKCTNMEQTTVHLLSFLTLNLGKSLVEKGHTVFFMISFLLMASCSMLAVILFPLTQHVFFFDSDVPEQKRAQRPNFNRPVDTQQLGFLFPTQTVIMTNLLPVVLRASAL